jgi:hypothetical protein
MISSVSLGAVGATLLGTITRIAQRFASSGLDTQTTLSDITKATRVEPIALVDRSISHQAYMTDVLTAANAIFAGYYLQAVALSATAVNGVTALKVLDRLNPDRGFDVNGALIGKALSSGRDVGVFAKESFQHCLPIPGRSVGLEAFGANAISNEADNSQNASPLFLENQLLEAMLKNAKFKVDTEPSSLQRKGVIQRGEEILAELNVRDRAAWREVISETTVNEIKLKNQRLKAELKNFKLDQDFENLKRSNDYRKLQEEILHQNDTSVSIRENKALNFVNEAVNLSVGRMFEVEIQQGNQNFKVPVSIRTISTIVDAEILAHILGGTGSNMLKFKERYHAWRAGQLSFISDIILMQDLIDQHRSMLDKDKSGAYAEIMRRRRDNRFNASFGGTPSVGVASNIVAISKRTAQIAEREGNGKFTDPKFRARVFNGTYMILLFVIDEDMERVSIYHRDIALPTQLSLKELKVANKGSGVDVMEVLKSYQLGQAVRL